MHTGNKAHKANAWPQPPQLIRGAVTAPRNIQSHQDEHVKTLEENHAKYLQEQQESFDQKMIVEDWALRWERTAWLGSTQRLKADI